MQINQINSSNSIHTTSNNLQDIMQNLDYSDKRILREALHSVDDKDLPKVIRAMSKIPPDTNYLKHLLNVVEDYKNTKNNGFAIYA